MCMISREEADKLLNNIIAANSLMNEVDAKIRTCGVNSRRHPEWHIFKPKDFQHIATLYGAEITPSPFSENSTKFTCMIKGIEIFVLERNRENEPYI